MWSDTRIYLSRPCVKFEQIVHREQIPQRWAGGDTQKKHTHIYVHTQMHTLRVVVDINIILWADA